LCDHRCIARRTATRGRRVRRLYLYSGVDWTGRVVTISERDLRKRKTITVDPFIKGRVSAWIDTTSLKLCGETDNFNNETDQVSRC
jgi:hypothetical protein